MSEVNLGVVRVIEGWVIVGAALRTRTYGTRLQAVSAVYRMADQIIGRDVRIHVQDDGFELKPGRRLEPRSAA
jgi:hypothetical protein